MNVVKEKILTQEVTRKQFLQLLAGGGLTLLGFSNFLSFFKVVTQSPAATTTDQHGFGSRKFGV